MGCILSCLESCLSALILILILTSFLSLFLSLSPCPAPSSPCIIARSLDRVEAYGPHRTLETHSILHPPSF